MPNGPGGRKLQRFEGISKATPTTEMAFRPRRFCFPRRSAGQRSLAKVVSITLITDGSSALAPTAVAPRSPDL
jgi:hypothetical protein